MDGYMTALVGSSLSASGTAFISGWQSRENFMSISSIHEEMSYTYSTLLSSPMAARALILASFSGSFLPGPGSNSAACSAHLPSLYCLVPLSFRSSASKDRKLATMSSVAAPMTLMLLPLKLPASGRRES